MDLAHAREPSLPARVFALALPSLGIATWFATTFDSFGSFMFWLDPASALGVCFDGVGVKRVCDFANHYYPQGRALLEDGPVSAVPGFFYSGFFAVCMRFFASLPYEAAAWLWQGLVLSASLCLLFAPLLCVFPLSLAGHVAYSLVYATSLPVLHDLAFGQVSAINVALVLLAFFSYRKERRDVAAVLLASAASIKFYPALFALYFVLRRDVRSLVVFGLSSAILLVAIPMLVLRPQGFFAFHGSLVTAIDRFAELVSATPFSSFVANAITYARDGTIDPTSLTYRAALVFGLIIAAFHAYLTWRIARLGARQSAWPSMMLLLASIPFLVRSSWLHYFVFLPLLQAYTFAYSVEPEAATKRRTLGLLSTILSALLVSVPAFVAIGPRAYYLAALPFWSTVLLLPVLEVSVIRRARS